MIITYDYLNVPIICEMLMKLPLLPQSAIVKGVLVGCSSFKHALPTLSRITESSFNIFVSSVSSSEHPG